MSRRGTRIGGAMPATQAMLFAQAMIGAASFTAADYYNTASPGGEPGDVGGLFGVALLFRITSQAVAADNRVAMERFTAGAGYRVVISGTNTGIRMFAADGGGVFIGSPLYTIMASDVGKIMLAVWQHDGSAVRSYVNRVEVGAGSAIVGYTAASAATSLGTGIGGSSTTVATTIFGMSTFRGVKTLAQIQALHDDVKIARDILGSGMAPTNGWSFKRAGGAAPPASVANLGSGTDAMSRVGSALTYDVVSQPVWGW